MKGWISKHFGHSQLLDIISFFRLLRLVALGKSMRDNECITLNKLGLQRRKGIFSYDWFDSIDKLEYNCLSSMDISAK